MDIIQSKLAEAYMSETLLSSPFSYASLYEVLKRFNLTNYCISRIPFKHDIVLRIDYRLRENLHTFIISMEESVTQDKYPTAILFNTHSLLVRS